MRKLFSFFVILIAASGFSQTGKTLDSLRNEIRKYDAAKKKSNAPFSIKDSVKVNLLNLVTGEYLQSDRENSILYTEKSLALAQKIGFKAGIGFVYINKSIIADNDGDFPTAITYLNKAIPLFKEANSRSGLSDSYSQLGIIYGEMGNYPEALKNNIIGLKMYEQMRNQAMIVKGYANIGILYNNQDKYPEALENFNKALNIISRNKGEQFQHMRCYVENSMGEVYQKQGKYEAALAIKLSALKNAAPFHDVYLEATTSLSVAISYSSLKNYLKAREYQFKALDFFKQLGYKSGEADCYINIGSNDYQLGDEKSAIANINRGLAMSKEIGDLNSNRIAYKTLSEIYSKKGDYRQAYENHVLFKKFNDSIFNTEKEKKFTESRMNYEFEKKNAVMKIQQEKEKQRQALVRNIIILVFMLVVVFLIILMIQRNKLANVRKQQALEEERNRISRDLHDNLGAQLSTAKMFIKRIKKAAKDDNMDEKIENLQEILEHSITDLRKIMNDMSGTTLHEKGYLAATEELVNTINRLHVITFTLSNHNISRFDAKSEHELFRITQELINNTLKYAEAANISLSITQRSGKIVMLYEDDGKGFDIETVGSGNGLKNIVSRVKSLEGTVEFQAIPGEGSGVIIEIPYKNA